VALAFARRRLLVLTAALCVLALGALFLERTRDRPQPELLRGLPAAFAEARPAFAQAVARAFPLPMAEASLRQRLRDDGFSLSSTAPAASFRSGRFLCEITWWIRWRATEGSVIEVATGITDRCL
jgi:hypothetical protein